MQYCRNLLASMLTVATTTALPVAADADGVERSLHPYLDRSHQFLVGAYFQDFTAEVRETRGPLPQQAINLGHLGVDETDTTWQVEYRHRFNDRWGLVASAQTFSSRGSLGIGREFNFGRITYPVGAELDTKIEVDTYVLDVVYTAYRSPRAELAIGVGIHAFDFTTEIEGRTFAGRDKNSESAAFEEFLAPLPNLRLQGFFAMNSRWSVIGGLGWMSANIDEWSGSFLYLNGRLQYLFTKRLGVALGYQFTDVDVSREQRRRDSEYDIEFSGPSVQLTFGF